MLECPGGNKTLEGGAGGGKGEEQSYHPCRGLAIKGLPDRGLPWGSWFDHKVGPDSRGDVEVLIRLHSFASMAKHMEEILKNEEDSRSSLHC